MDVPPFQQPLDAILSSQNWLANMQHTLSRIVRATAFWIAVLLPFLYVPLLLHGISGRDEQTAFVGMVVLNVCAFVVGHGYRR